MKKIFDLLKDKDKMMHYFLYLVFGILATIVDFGIFKLLTTFVPSLNSNISNIIGIASSMIFAYFTNSKYVFKSTEKDKLKEFFRFIMSRMTSTLFNIISFWLLTAFTSINEMIIKALISIVVIVLNYVFSKLFVFNDTSDTVRKNSNIKFELGKSFFYLLALIIVFQFSFFGLRYFGVVDDNNQFGIYHLRSDDLYNGVLKNYKAYDVRPLAFITDIFIFSWFWDNMYALLVILLIMHVANLFFISKICEKIDVKLNAFCIVLFALCPILVESVYWISASTRIVFSLFLCLASIYLLLESFDEDNNYKKLIKFLSAIILNLSCVGYYEQTIAINLFFACFVLICLKKYRYIFIPIISTTWIGIWYIYFMINGKMQSRGALNISGILGKTIECAREVCINYKNAYLNFVYSLGFGVESIKNTLASIVLFIIIGIFVYYIYKNNCNKDENKRIFRKLAIALIFIITPILPFIVLKSSVIAVRNLYFTTLGIAIVIEILIDLMLKFISNDKICCIIKTTILCVIMIFFAISNIDGANNYKKVNEIDQKIVNQIISALDESIFKEKKSISINYDANQLYKYKNLSNFVESTVESDWALLAKIQVMRQDTHIGKVYINSNENVADYVLYFDNEMNLVNVIENN